MAVMTTFLIILLPVLAAGRIHIDIHASNTYYNTRVDISGESEHLITDKDREIFQLRDWELSDAAYMHSGGRPDDVYLRGPTPWGNLYLNYGWEEVKRSIVPKTAKILDISTDTLVVARKRFSNNSPFASSYSVSLSKQADMSVRNTWIAGSSYSFAEQVSYSVSIGYGSVGKSRSVSYSNWLGNEKSKTSRVSIGSDISVNPVLQPGQSVEVVLTAKRSVLKLEVTYLAYLRGRVACNYSNKFKEHYFWSYSVNKCLEAVGKPQNLYLKEVIEVGFYFDEDVTSA